ncbi:hypothetical protein [Mycobacterium shinjukuense]|uniref:Uncharacterized protein n=1 Tax=Mycobacterium shinjukuense TaxID=398694 RepID=A0A7I7MMK0_9MYCO|nr:hypothetical protein BST45_12215 [Mycobacterium shinjukuense]BBX73415.1 hypothetical protein MSHI_13210 [Mycobacterium shinjukuense]
MPVEVVRPTFDRLVANGYAVLDEDRLSLTQSGVQQVDLLSAPTLDWAVENLAISAGAEIALSPAAWRPAPSAVTGARSPAAAG